MQKEEDDSQLVLDSNVDYLRYGLRPKELIPQRDDATREGPNKDTNTPSATKDNDEMEGNKDDALQRENNTCISSCLYSSLSHSEEHLGQG